MYNLLLTLLKNVIWMVSHLDADTKMLRFARGQRGLLRRITATHRPDASRPTVWIHCASLGEYAIARPIIKRLRSENPRRRFVLTFFSPTGYEAVTAAPPLDIPVDEVYYLPLDTRRSARRFVTAIDPEMAIFTVSEYWYNYLRCLSKRAIPTYLVSARITPGSIFFKPYGYIHRRCLRCYTRICVLEKKSVELLRSLGVGNVDIIPDPLHLNAREKARQQWSDDVIEQFLGDTPRERVMVAGSLHDDNDLQLVAEAVNTHADIKFIIVPHEVSAHAIDAIAAAIHSPVACYCRVKAEGTEAIDSACRVLVVDTVGMLAYIYRYGAMAYVGGGFTRLIHSVIEAAVYGIPVAFGPRIERQNNPRILLDNGQGTVTPTPRALVEWIDRNRATSAASSSSVFTSSTANGNR